MFATLEQHFKLLISSGQKMRMAGAIKVDRILSAFSNLHSFVLTGRQWNPIPGQGHLHRLRPHEHDPGNVALTL